MKRAGCVLGIAGLLLCVASFALFGTSIFRAMKAREARLVPVTVGEPVDSGIVQVATDQFCRVALRAIVRSGHARQGVGEYASWELEYGFPFRYTAYDESGAVLMTEAKDFASDGSPRTKSKSRVSEEGGSIEIEQGFEKFAVAPPGTLRVVAHLDADRDFEANIEKAELVLYDKVSKHTQRITAGVVLMVLGGGAGLLGAVLLIAAVVRENRG